MFNKEFQVFQMYTYIKCLAYKIKKNKNSQIDIHILLG